MCSSYIAKLNRMVLAEGEAAKADSTWIPECAVSAMVGEGTTARIPELQRSLRADPRAIGAVLRKLGFRAAGFGAVTTTLLRAGGGREAPRPSC